MEFILTATTHNYACKNIESKLDEYVTKIRNSSEVASIITKDEDGDYHLYMPLAYIVRLAELLEEDIIIHPSFKGDHPTLEIYDTYREL